ncbi:MAG: hypothetical protein KIT33_08435 [Candidatus Kapabacteria bacterium]|nr:hypothetical protein [Ignavibacteriota bacterium]MCW5884982.1 hypothetical protein [Candidatus Kapabacteria bacterium]
MLTSPHGDGEYDDEGIKVFAHQWEYYMTGAFGEEIVQYKGFQTSADVGMGPERKVYLGAYRYRAGGELLYHHDGTKEVNFTDNNGSVRLVVRQNGTAFDTLHFDYKPFGDTLWTSGGNMSRDNFDGSIYDSESDLQMLGFRMYDNETGRFTTPDLLWSAFPAQTPYHYAYNSPLTYRDPSGLAPEKEKEGEELLDLNPEDVSGGYYFSIWQEQEAIRYNGMIDYWNSIFAELDATFGNVMKLNDFNLSYGGGSGGRTAEGKGAENGQGGNTTDDNEQGNNQLQNDGKSEKDATDMYKDDPSKSTVLQDISKESREKSWNQTVRDQKTNKQEAGGTIRKSQEEKQVVVPAQQIGASEIDPFYISGDFVQPIDFESYNVLATYHGHGIIASGQFPNFNDLGTFMSGRRYTNIRYHITYITINPQRVFVWDNHSGRGFIFCPTVWIR